MPTTLVTGCSTGIGRATAVRFARGGHTVWATMRDPARAAGLTDEAGPGTDVRVVPMDVTDPASVAAALEAAGPVDVLVNNAGVAPIGPVEEQPIEQWQAAFDTNVLGPLRLIQAVLPGMRARRHGAVVTVSSVLGEAVSSVMGAYAASKHAVEALCEALWHELDRGAVRVAIVQPGLVRSEVAHHGTAALTLAADSPWRDLAERVATGWSAMVDAGSAPEDVAEVIWAAAHGDGSRLRWPVARMGTLHAGDWLAAQRAVRTAEWERLGPPD